MGSSGALAALGHSAASGLDGTLLFLVVEARAVFFLGRESRAMLKHWEGKGVKMAQWAGQDYHTMAKALSSGSQLAFLFQCGTQGLL